MALKNLPNQVQCVANVSGVVATGTCKAMERFQASFLSLLSLPLAGPYPTGATPDNQGVLRAGRSARLGVSPTWSMSPSSMHRERKAIIEARTIAVG
jgi:hypothetical protein